MPILNNSVLIVLLDTNVKYTSTSLSPKHHSMDYIMWNLSCPGFVRNHSIRSWQDLKPTNIQAKISHSSSPILLKHKQSITHTDTHLHVSCAWPNHTPFTAVILELRSTAQWACQSVTVTWDMWPVKGQMAEWIPASGNNMDTGSSQAQRGICVTLTGITVLCHNVTTS